MRFFSRFAPHRGLFCYSVLTRREIRLLNPMSEKALIGRRVVEGNVALIVKLAWRIHMT